MNIRDNATIRAPSGKDDLCAVFTIDTTDEPFVLQDIAEERQEYTLSFYARSESSGGISVADKSMAVGVGWKRYVVTFVADDVDLPIYFTTAGTYYLYNTQLEIGNKDTDFALNPADTEQSLDDLTVVVNNHSTQFSIMDGQISALIAEDATIRGEYDALVSRTTAIEANLDGITSRVTLTEADISGVDRRLTEAESTIVQQAGEIALTTEYIAKKGISENNPIQKYIVNTAPTLNNYPTSTEFFIYDKCSDSLYCSDELICGTNDYYNHLGEVALIKNVGFYYIFERNTDNVYGWRKLSDEEVETLADKYASISVGEGAVNIVAEREQERCEVNITGDGMKATTFYCC